MMANICGCRRRVPSDAQRSAAEARERHQRALEQTLAVQTLEQPGGFEAPRALLPAQPEIAGDAAGRSRRGS